jgi:hypothetical protein
MSAAKSLVVLLHSSIAHRLPLFQAVYLHLSKKVAVLAFSASFGVSVPYPYHGVSWCRLPIILATIQRPILRFIYDIVISGQGSRRRKKGALVHFFA